MSTGRASVMSWDYRQKPDLDHLSKMVRDLSNGTLHLTEVEDTGMDEYALVVSTVRLTPAAVQATFERWWVPEDPDGDRPDVLELDEVADYEPVSAETIAGVRAVVDAPYRPGLDAQFEDEETP